MKQEQFLEVIDRDEAERRFWSSLDLRPLDAEQVTLGNALDRVLARDIVAPIDVPGFDRSNVDGFALHAADTFGASEESPRLLRLNSETLAPGLITTHVVQAGAATCIATGAVVPRGADAVVMIEFTDADGDRLLVRRAVPPGANITFAGTDIGRGETVLRIGDLLTSRETGVLAALGFDKIMVVRRPRVAIISTGDELIAPGSATRPGLVYDSNATVLADAVRELGAEPISLGIVRDDEVALSRALHQALERDLVLLSGGTSKGAGDLSYRAVARLGSPGILVHGVALKPGKPLCLAAVRLNSSRTVPVVILPGFPTSTIFTFHDFVAPVLRQLAGRPEDPVKTVRARLPFRINSERGRTEYVLVNLVSDTSSNEGVVTQPGAPRSSARQGPSDQRAAISYTAYPMDKGSGSVTSFGRADGYLTIPRQCEYLEADEEVEVRLIGRDIRPADLLVIGSHCVGLDYLLGKLQERGVRSKFLAVGSMGGLTAARRGECDVAGIHLLDPKTGQYNAPFLSDELMLVRGYGRLQGIIYRPGDSRFEGRTVTDAVRQAVEDAECTMINRNQGSGTRILIDRLLGTARPPGYLVEAKSHNAVAAAVEQDRADWGLAIVNVAKSSGLAFLPLQAEQYDFIVPRARFDRPSVRSFYVLLGEDETRATLAEMSFEIARLPGVDNSRTKGEESDNRGEI
jgi:putative molybdopterin biosynthesis protein